MFTVTLILLTKFSQSSLFTNHYHCRNFLCFLWTLTLSSLCCFFFMLSHARLMCAISFLIARNRRNSTPKLAKKKLGNKENSSNGLLENCTSCKNRFVIEFNANLSSFWVNERMSRSMDSDLTKRLRHHQLATRITLLYPVTLSWARAKYDVLW